jgi:proliferating cell nuclear antigen PCNA
MAEPVFSFQIPAKELKIIVAILNELSTDINIGFYPQGVEIATMDDAHISLIKCRIDADKLPSYVLEERGVLGVIVEQLHRILGHAKVDNTVTVSKRRGTELLTVTVEHTGSLSYTSTSNIPLIDIEEDQYEPTDEEYGGCMEMLSVDFKEIVSELYSMGDKAEIKMDFTGAASFSMMGETGAGHEIVLHPATSANLTVDASMPVSAGFALRYLSMFSKAADFKRHVVLKLANEKPGYFEFPFQFGAFFFYLAPQIAND